MPALGWGLVAAERRHTGFSSRFECPVMLTNTDINPEWAALILKERREGEREETGHCIRRRVERMESGKRGEITSRHTHTRSPHAVIVRLQITNYVLESFSWITSATSLHCSPFAVLSPLSLVFLLFYGVKGSHEQTE